MKCGVNIQTKEGLKYYGDIFNMFEQQKSMGMLDFFVDLMDKEIERSDYALERFLEDDDLCRQYKMNEEDSEGWKIWKLEADRNAVLRFFSKRGHYETENA